MNEKSYNMYLKMLKLACRNVRAAICQENGITDTSQVQVKIRDRDGLVNIVAAIVSTPDSADTIYATRVERRLVIVSDVTILHQINAASVFIKSILKSRSARICQKQMVNYLMAERYLDAAWDYDMQNKTEDDSMPNVEYAKSVIIDRYSLNFIGGFLLTERPRIEPTILNGLKTQAFDERYSLMTEEQNAKIADRRYAREFESRTDVFLASSPVSFKVDTVKDTEQKSMIDVFINKSKTSETDIIAQLYQTSFANIPLQKRRRRFVNLKSKNRDVEICPENALGVKRQFSQIEATTKHTYIMNYFNDNMQLGSDRSSYYFEQEAWMYKYMWQTDGIIYAQSGNIYLPDGTAIAIPDSMTDYEFFHRINTVYAALFGFTPEDAVGGANWLIDSIRSAYTDEGNALYRLTVIDKRLENITAEREEQSKW